MQTSNIKIYFALITTIILWASAYVVIRIGLRGYSPGGMALLRYLIASACMAFIYFRLPVRRRIQWQDLPAILLAGILGIGIYNISLNYGELTVTASAASFITGQNPLIVTILAVVFLGERLTRRGLLGLLIGFIGLLIIALGHRADVQASRGLWFVFVAVFAGSCYITFQKQVLKKFSAVEATSFAIWGGTLSMLYYLPAVFRGIHHASFLITGSVIYLGVFPAAIAYVCWSYVLSHMPASRAVGYQYAIPLVTTLMGWLILREWPPALVLLGGGVAMAGTIVATWKKRKRL